MLYANAKSHLKDLRIHILVFPWGGEEWKVLEPILAWVSRGD